MVLRFPYFGHQQDPQCNAIVSDDSSALGFSGSTSSAMLLFCNDLKHHHIFVSQGLGVVHLPLRSYVNCLPALSMTPEVAECYHNLSFFHLSLPTLYIYCGFSASFTAIFSIFGSIRKTEISEFGVGKFESPKVRASGCKAIIARKDKFIVFTQSDILQNNCLYNLNSYY
jgi:hypothetical protein